MSAKAKRITTQDIKNLNAAYNAAQAQTQQAQNNAAKYSAASSYSGSKAGANAGLSALNKSGTTAKATQGLLPKTDYNFTQNFGNDPAMINAIAPIAAKAGYGQDYTTANSHFKKKDDINTNAWKSNIEEIKAKYPDLFAGSGFSYTPVSYTPMANVGGFAPSQEYLDAMAYTQSLLDKINTGKTSYSDRVDAMMDTIANRDKFSYDFNTDPLFQNALASAMTSGQTAMQDTMGQAAALTGGYGSSYATSAANQTYNQFVQDAYAQLPEYYKLALDAYTREGDELYNQLGMYRDADNTEYGRLTNAYGLNYQKAQDLYGQEYNNYWDTTNANIGIDQYNANLAMKVNDENYQRAKDAYNMSLKSSGASETGADATMENVGASSADYQKALSMYEDVVKKYGADSKQAMEQGANIADTFGLSEQQVYTMVNQGDAYFTPQAQLRESDETPWLRDQNGKPLSNSAASFVSWGTDSSGNKIYKNLETGATYTEEQLKNLKWDKYKK